MKRRPIARLRGDRRGSAIIEFALIAPMMVLTLLGLGDLAYQGYMHSVLIGAVEKAGRDSTIEGAGSNTATIDKTVMSYVNTLNKSATMVSSTRKNFANFSGAGPEPYDDNDNDGKYTMATDCFYDTNGNGVWDSSPAGDDGQGGADDVTVYTIQIQYPHIFPMPNLISSWSQKVLLTASTILKNQPYGPQGVSTPTKVCPS